MYFLLGPQSCPELSQRACEHCDVYKPANKWRMGPHNMYFCHNWYVDASTIWTACIGLHSLWGSSWGGLSGWWWLLEALIRGTYQRHLLEVFEVSLCFQTWDTHVQQIRYFYTDTVFHLVTTLGLSYFCCSFVPLITAQSCSYVDDGEPLNDALSGKVQTRLDVFPALSCSFLLSSLWVHFWPLFQHNLELRLHLRFFTHPWLSELTLWKVHG